MSRFIGRPVSESLLVALCALAVFLPGQSRIPIINGDEARFAQATREMLARGDMVVPTFGGANRYDKPILIYWLTAASYRILGVNERAARLPSNVAAAVLAGCLAWTARRRWGPGAGWLAGLALVATPVFQVQARACTADLVMMLPTTLAMLALWRILDGDGGFRTALVLWFGLAFSVLAKGPVGPMIAISTLGALWAFSRSWPTWQIWCSLGLFLAGIAGLGLWVLAVPLILACVEVWRDPRCRDALRRARPLTGMVVAIVVLTPWAIAAYVATDGEYLRVAIGRHVIERSLASLEGHSGFPLFYPLTAIVVAFPWFGLLVPALGVFRREVRDRGSMLFLAAWLVGPLVVLELMGTKLVHYWMPAYPAGILLVVAWLMRPDRVAVGLRRVSGAIMVFGGVFVAVVEPGVASRFDQIVVEPVGWLSAVFLVGSVLLWSWLGWRRKREVFVVLMAATVAHLLLLFSAFLPRLGAAFVGPQAAQLAQELKAAGERVVVFKLRYEEVLFYLPLDTKVVRDKGTLDEILGSTSSKLLMSRTRDLDSLKASLPNRRLTIVGRVSGIDLSRGRLDEVCMLREMSNEGQMR
ncbi:MAG: glycosyltransferase family 39 protein [bacterium]|nr:glycosyltransferase family 39 protein [bacterium]